MTLFTIVGTSWCPNFKSSECNSFKDQVPVDEIYVCPIFKLVCRDLTTQQGIRIIAHATLCPWITDEFTSLVVNYGISNTVVLEIS